ncbi:PH domain-containing protein [Alteromonas sp. H39]|uniref:PH domain-containing protein n=1 Tax=Alteromonas sp. H39 TaxID=3389876 RepID=UPI0039DFB3AA
MQQDTPAFSNSLVTPEALPDARALETLPLSPHYRTLNLAIVTVVFALLLIGVSVVRFQQFVPVAEGLVKAYPFVLVILAALGILSFLYHVFADPLIRYAVREQDLILQNGLFFRATVCQPILRVQHIELKRGPLDRMAKMAKLQVYSAGGSAHTFEIPGLPEARARQLRQFILDHKDLDAR